MRKRKLQSVKSGHILLSPQGQAGQVYHPRHLEPLERRLSQYHMLGQAFRTVGGSLKGIYRVDISAFSLYKVCE